MSRFDSEGFDIVDLGNNYIVVRVKNSQLEVQRKEGVHRSQYQFLCAINMYAAWDGTWWRKDEDLLCSPELWAWCLDQVRKSIQEAPQT